MPFNHHQDGPVTGRLVYLVEEQANPSTDFYVVPAVSSGGHRWVRCGFTDLPAADELAGAVVVFVRYVPSAWARLVETARRRLGGLVFFMDDDVLDLRASAGMPWAYRLKLARLAASRLPWLRRNAAQLWVSTPYLQEKYASWRPRLVAPCSAAATADARRVFYHGTGSHFTEIRWLRPVMEEALRRDPGLSFELVGGTRVHRLYRELPRVTVVHQMKWPAYQAFLAMPGRHVGLAPLLDGPFNRARSYTKLFDITRGGAAGIYAAGGACAEVVTPGVDGLVVEMKPEAWVDAIARLARDDALRRTLLDNARRKVAELAQRAQAGYPDLTAGWSRARGPS